MGGTAKVYIAGIGMITSIGANTEMTAAAVKAGISGYTVSDFYNLQHQPITMATVPDEVFSSIEFGIDEGDHYGEQYDRIIKMAILALREAISHQAIKQPVPLVLAMPEAAQGDNYVPTDLLMTNLLKQKDVPLRSDQVRYMPAGRAAGIQGLDWAMHDLYQKGANFVLVGGSDSHCSAARIYELDEADRLLAPNRMDGFAPGEGAGFLLLTRHPQQAISRDGHIVALSQLGNGQEPGHFYSDQPYRGEGLDQAFKQALSEHTGDGIHTVYASMNGESYWAKEYGVAAMRNGALLQDAVKTEHPADCYGDLGVATGPVLLGLAAENLWKQPGLATHLVYSSSDGPWRAAVRVEKLPRTASR